MRDLRLLPLLAGETVEQKIIAFRNYDDGVSALCVYSCLAIDDL